MPLKNDARIAGEATSTKAERTTMGVQKYRLVVVLGLAISVAGCIKDTTGVEEQNNLSPSCTANTFRCSGDRLEHCTDVGVWEKADDCLPGLCNNDGRCEEPGNGGAGGLEADANGGTGGAAGIGGGSGGTIGDTAGSSGTAGSAGEVGSNADGIGGTGGEGGAAGNTDAGGTAGSGATGGSAGSGGNGGTAGSVAGPSLSGHVYLLGETDHSGTEVRVKGSSFAAFTDSSGYFEIWGIPYGCGSFRTGQSSLDSPQFRA